MVNLSSWSLQIFLALLLAIGSTLAHAQATPVAKVDRTVIAVDESLTLTLQINKAGSVSSPNLTGLRSNFHIIGNSKSSNHTFTNGRSESLTSWEITLIPKQVGQLLIPAITIDGKKTQPIEIDVRPSVPISQDDVLPVYLESEVDQNEVYIQQQIVYTLRIFQSVQLDNMNVSEPEFDNAAIKKLSQNSYQRRIKNTPYRVHELRYAIFPQQSGELTIPEAVFTANAAVTRRSVFSLPGQGKPIRKMSKQHDIIVRKPPTSFKGNTWLPAKSIKLVEDWSSEPNDIRVGESITRNITINAEGLMDSQLPPIEFPIINGIKYYPDKAQTESTETDQGVSSFRTDSTALIPTRDGSLTLPEIRIAWWDTKANKMREAHLPESTITVKPSLDDSITSIPAAMDHSQITTKLTPTTITTSAPSTENTLYWQVACAVLAIAWLVTMYLWLTLKQRFSGNNLPGKPEIFTKELTEKQAYKELASFCHNNDIKNVRKAIIQWSQAYWPEKNIHSFQDIQRQCEHKPFTNELLQLDEYLYGTNADSGQWNGENLLTAINLLKRHDKNAKETTTPALAPLYPS